MYHIRYVTMNRVPNERQTYWNRICSRLTERIQRQGSSLPKSGKLADDGDRLNSRSFAARRRRRVKP